MGNATGLFSNNLKRGLYRTFTFQCKRALIIFEETLENSVVLYCSLQIQTSRSSFKIGK